MLVITRSDMRSERMWQSDRRTDRQTDRCWHCDNIYLYLYSPKMVTITVLLHT